MNFINRLTLVLAILSAFTVAESASAQVSTWTNVFNVDLGTGGSDFDFDLTRNLAYVSLQNTNEIAYVSLSSGEVTARQSVSARPVALDYGRHSDQIYVALNGAGTVAQINPDTQAVNEIFVAGSNGTNNPNIFDVVEAADGQVFASASNGFSSQRIARIDTNNDNSVTQVADNRGTSGSPRFLTTPAEDRLYVGENFSGSLIALDITNDQAPIVLESIRGSLGGGTTVLSISPDGERIYLASGRVLRAENFLQAGRIGTGRAQVSSDGETAFVFQDGNLIGYDTNTFLTNDEIIELPEEFNFVTEFAFLPDNRGVIALSGQSLFIATSAAAVPEPGCEMLAVLGLFAGFSRRRRR